MGQGLLLISYRKSISPFNQHQNQRPWTTLKPRTKGLLAKNI